jgi:hypothetical protein
MRRIVAGMAAGLAAVAAFAAAGHAGDVWPDLKACRSLGDAERLACFDRALARHDAAASATAKPNADFGSERLQKDDAAASPETMTAKVAQVRWNMFKHFSVTLDNGQVWRQLDSDTAVARLDPAATVKITRGFLDSYSLSVEGEWGVFKVKRIK